MTLYKNRYRIETIRKSGHDYSKPGYYFVTICTKKRMQWFGEIVNEEMMLSPFGKTVQDRLQAIPKHFTNTKIDTFCMMPDHIHLILCIAVTPYVQAQVQEIQQVETRDSRVSTMKFKLPPKSVGSIINQLKGVITKQSRLFGFEYFQWQPRFYDRIIRSEKERYAIRQYIQNNQKTWDKETIPWHADATSWFL